MKPAKDEQGDTPQSAWSTLSYWDGNLLARCRRFAGKAGGTERTTMWSSDEDDVAFVDKEEFVAAVECWKADDDDWWWLWWVL